MAVARAPGTTTIGVDSKGKHYKYESGKGRGRQPLNLNPAQAKALQAKGLRPGNDLHLSPTEAAMLGGGGSQQQQQTLPRGAKPQKQNLGNVGPSAANPDIGAQSSAIIKSHQKWFKSGVGASSRGALERLSNILSEQNVKWLENAGPKPTAAQKNFAGSILATIFNRDFGRRSKTDAGKDTKGKTALSVQFNPGGNGKNGFISLTEGDKTRGSVAFESLRKLTTDQIDQLRDGFAASKRESGRPAPGSSHELYDSAERAIDASPIKRGDEYKKSMRSIFNTLPTKATDLLKKSGAEFQFYDDAQTLTNALDSDAKTVLMPGTTARGMYRVRGGKGVLHLDGGETYGDLNGVHVHEMYHAIDHAAGWISKSKEWDRAHKVEASSVSNYAKKSAQESFAEFARKVYSGRTKSSLEAEHPLMFAEFDKHGLLPDNFPSADKTSGPLKDVLDTPIVSKGTLGDAKKDATAKTAPIDGSKRAPVLSGLPRGAQLAHGSNPTTGLGKSKTAQPTATPAPKAKSTVTPAKHNKAESFHNQITKIEGPATPAESGDYHSYKIHEGSKHHRPRYSAGFGGSNSAVKFKSDFDRASYLVGSIGRATGKNSAETNRDRRTKHADLIEHLTKQTGLNELDIRAHAEKIRAKLKELSQMRGTGEDLNVDPVPYDKGK